MYIPFDKIPADSRIWIYQCNRELTDHEIKKISDLAKEFIEEWTAHQQALQASFVILHNIFLILSVNQNYNEASGCSVDKSVHFIKQLEKIFNVSFLDRFNVAYKIGEKVEVKPYQEFISFFNQEKLTDSLTVFNNLVLTKGDLTVNWEIPLKKSWIAQKV